MPARHFSKVRTGRLSRWMPLALLLVPLLSAAQELKIGYVDFERVAESSPQIARGKALLEEEFRPRNEVLATEEKRLQEMEERLLRDGPVMTESQQQTLERDARALRRQVQRDREDLIDEFNFRLNEVQQEVEKEIEQIVRGFARENGYDLILVTHTLYVSETVDITDEVIEILRTDFAAEGEEPDA